VRAFLGYFVGWPGTWEHLRKRFWLGLGILAGLWLGSAVVVSWTLMAWGARGPDTIDGNQLVGTLSFLVLYLQAGAVDFLAFLGLVSILSLVLGKENWAEAIGAGVWAWLIIMPSSLVFFPLLMSFASIHSIAAIYTGAIPVRDPLHPWFPLETMGFLEVLCATVSPAGAWAMLIFGGFASRVFGKKWPLGIAVSLGAWALLTLLRAIILLPFGFTTG
jgi:hypothetical protein